MRKYREIEKSDLNYKTRAVSEPFKFIGKPIEIIRYENKICRIYFAIPFEGDLRIIQVDNFKNQRIIKDLELNKTYRIYTYWKEYYHEGIDKRGDLLVIARVDEILDFNINDVEGFNFDNKKSEYLSKPDVIELLQKTINPNLFYVYGLVDQLKNELFYIGKGKGIRIFNHETQGEETNTTKKYLQLSRNAWGIDLKYQFLGYNLSENEAFDPKESTIKEYGRRYYDEGGILTNILEGGRDKRLKYLHRKKHGVGIPEDGKLMQRFEITGFHYLKPELKKVVITTLKKGDELILEPHPENQYDKTAIKVLLGNNQIGWVSKYFDKKEQLFNELIEGKKVQLVCSQMHIKPKDTSSLPPDDDDLFYTYYDVELIEGKYEIDK